MRKLHKLFPAVVLAVAATEGSAQLIYEPFDYGSSAIGTNLANLTGSPTFGGYTNPQSGTRWFATGTASAPNEITVASGNISVPTGLSAAAGDHVNGTTNAKAGIIGLGGVHYKTGSYYYSMALQLTDLTNLSTATNGVFIAAFTNRQGTATATNTIVGARLQLRRDSVDPTRFDLGIQNGGTGSPSLWETTDGASAHGVGDILYLVGRFTYGAGAGDDTAALWVNPSSTDFGAGNEPTPTVTHTADMNATDSNVAVGSFMLRTENTLNPLGISYDEVRVDTSWAQVTAPTGSSWTGATDTDWTNAGNWSGTVPNAGGAFGYFTGSGGTVNLTSAQTAGTLTIKSTSSYTITGSTLTFDGNRPATSDTLGTGAINVQAVTDATTGAVLASSHTISAPISIANLGNSDQAPLAISVASSQTLTLSGVVSATQSGAYVSKTGGGTLIMSGSNTFTGGVRIVGGVLQANSDAALGADPGTPTTNIRLRGGANGLSILRYGSAFTLDSDRTIQIENFNTSSGAAFLGGIDTNGFNVSLDSQITRLTAGVNAILVKVGAGTLTLTNTANDQSQNRIDAGTLRVASEAPLGPAPVSPGTNITFNGGTLQFGASFNPSNNRTILLNAAGGTIDTDGNSVTWGNTINGAGALTKAGAGTLNVGGSNGYSGGTNVNGGTLEIFNDANLGNFAGSVSFGGGTLKINSTFANTARAVNVNAGGGTIDTNGFNLDFGNTAGAGSLTKSSTGAYTTGHVRTAGLTVSAGSVVVAAQAAPDNASSAAGTSKITSVSVSGGAKLDIKNNKLITASPIGSHNGTNYTDITGLIESGRNGGVWDGAGITTSMTDATTGSGYTMLGVATGSEARGIGATDTDTWGGQTVTGTDTLVMYTYGGDANLSGNVDVDDYGQIDFNASTGGVLTGWFNGDFDYNGFQDVDDYGVIDFVINIQGPAFYIAGGTSIAAVPEPASVGLIGLGAMGLLSRRRRSR